MLASHFDSPQQLLDVLPGQNGQATQLPGVVNEIYLSGGAFLSRPPARLWGSGLRGAAREKKLNTCV